MITTVKRNNTKGTQVMTLKVGKITVVLALVLAWETASAQSYTVTEIPPLVGGSIIVHKVNFGGQFVGGSGTSDGGNTRAFVSTGGAGLQVVGMLPGGDYSEAFAVNHAGDVAGRANAATTVHAFLWTRSSATQDLGALPGDNSSQAFGLNDAGHVVGVSSGKNGIHAFLWSKSTGMQNLGVLPGGKSSQAYGINNSDS